MKWVWLIGGGIMQYPMLRKIRERGYKSLVTDGNPECRCAWEADAFFRVSTYDIKGHLELASKLKDSGIAGVLTVAADVGPTVSAVAHVLSLPACSLASAIAARDKVSMRVSTALLSKHPVWMALPATRAEAAWHSWDTWARSKGIPSLPCVVKAPDNRASRGMTVVRRPEDMAPAVRKAASSAIQRKDTVLIEEFLEGEEYAIDTFIVDGKARVVNIAKRIFHEPGIEAGHINPGAFDPEMERIATEYAEALGVDQGPFKLDLVKHPRYGWCVLETATRLSGGFDHMCTAVVGPGKDITGLMLDFALGLPFDGSKLESKIGKYAACYAPVFEPGTILGYLYHGSPELPDGVIVVNRREIPPLETSADRPIFVIETGDSEEEAWEKAKEIASGLEPMYA